MSINVKILRFHGIIISAAVSSLLSILIPSMISAADGPGTAGAIYLRLPVGPKSIAMGEAAAALPGDPFAWLSNPGSTAGPSSSGIGIFHSQWAMDTYYDNISFNMGLGRFVDFRAALTYMSTPEVQGYSMNGLPTTSLKNSNFQGILGLAVTPIENLGIGLNVKYFQEVIADWTASGVGIDAGAWVRVPVAGLSFGASVCNVGPKIKFIDREEELPMVIRVGGAWEYSLMPAVLGLTLAADAVMPSHEDTYPALGAELNIKEIVGVRIGYNGEKDRANGGLTTGAGVKILESLWLDYAYTPYGDLGSFHRLSLYVGF